MLKIIQYQKKFSSLKEVKPLLPNINQSTPLIQSNIIIPISKKLKEQEPKKEKTFLTKRKGRKYKISSLKEVCEEKGKKVHSKFSNDNIKRRLKGLYNNYIIHLLNNLIKKRFKNHRLKFVKMNIKITKDLGIEYNKNLLRKRIKDIIINVSNKYTNKDNNKDCIKFVLSQNNTDEIINILNMTYKDLYTEYYLKSTEEDYSYESNKEKVLEIYGKEYLDKFIQNAENFVEFYFSGKKRKSRKQNDVGTINIALENDNYESVSTGDLNVYDNSEKNLKNKNLVSTCTQTDINGINVKLIAFA